MKIKSLLKSTLLATSSVLFLTTSGSFALSSDRYPDLQIPLAGSGSSYNFLGSKDSTLTLLTIYNNQGYKAALYHINADLSYTKVDTSVINKVIQSIVFETTGRFGATTAKYAVAALSQDGSTIAIGVKTTDSKGNSTPNLYVYRVQGDQVIPVHFDKDIPFSANSTTIDQIQLSKDGSLLGFTTQNDAFENNQNTDLAYFYHIQPDNSATAVDISHVSSSNSCMSIAISADSTHAMMTKIGTNYRISAQAFKIDLNHNTTDARLDYLGTEAPVTKAQMPLYHIARMSRDGYTITLGDDRALSAVYRYNANGDLTAAAYLPKPTSSGTTLATMSLNGEAVYSSTPGQGLFSTVAVTPEPLALPYEASHIVQLTEDGDIASTANQDYSSFGVYQFNADHSWSPLVSNLPGQWWSMALSVDGRVFVINSKDDSTINLYRLSDASTTKK